jgi:NAD(P)-dependent dehydrogenase (short-subunit alcohol dehydrogenase family)
VVTGAGSEIGIGKETALAMAAEGANIVVNDIGKDPDGSWGADRVVKQIKEAKGMAVANYDSVTSMEGGANIIKAAVSNFGRIDILVNTAGNVRWGETLKEKEADWDAVIAVHLKGLFSCTRAAIREMIKQKSGGRIINITSAAAWGGGGGTAYSIGKAGVLGFSKMLSLEMRQYGITVNVISPKARTRLFNIPEELQGGVPIVGPEYVAPAIVYLATDEAKDITGQIIFAGAGDIIVYAPPLRMPGEHQHLHKAGKWTVDELVRIMPYMVWSQKANML